jgi:membrane protein YqaA with SNARE-associated domain
MALGATLSMTVPVTFVLLFAVLAKPQQWLRIWLWSCFGSAIGASFLVLVFQHLVWGQIYTAFPKFETSELWLHVTNWILDYGLIALTWATALPLPQTPALILCGVTHLSVEGVFTAVLIGKLVKYGVVTRVVYHFPERFARFSNSRNVEETAINSACNIPLELTDTAETPENFLEEWPEGGDFYRVTQLGGIPGFSFGYLVAKRAGIREAVVPYFITDFKFNTMLENSLLKRLLSGLHIRIACVGHPTVGLGRIDGPISTELLDRVFEVLSTKIPLVAFKGFGYDLPVHGFIQVAALPVAVLHVAGDFWSTLHTHKKRNDFRRKLKAAATLRFEEHDGLPGEYLDQVHQLYMNTYDRAAVHFECLSSAYFSGTSSLSIYILAFLEERLVGFFQLLPKGDRVVAKYVGMDYAVSREHGVYFSLYLHALDICARKGFKEIEFGESAYYFKKELGCELVNTWVYYRHRNFFVNALLARLAFLFKPSENELR